LTQRDVHVTRAGSGLCIDCYCLLIHLRLGQQTGMFMGNI